MLVIPLTVMVVMVLCTIMLGVRVTLGGAGGGEGGGGEGGGGDGGGGDAVQVGAPVVVGHELHAGKLEVIVIPGG